MFKGVDLRNNITAETSWMYVTMKRKSLIPIKTLLYYNFLFTAKQKLKYARKKIMTWLLSHLEGTFALLKNQIKKMFTVL